MFFSLYLTIIFHIFILCSSRLPKLHQVVYVNPNDYIVVNHKQINFYRGTTPTYYLNFINKPIGNFFQLSHVFSKHGYIPYNGKEIINSSIITGTKGRFVYRLKKINYYQSNNSIIDSVNIMVHVTDHNNKPINLSGKIVFLPKSGTFVSSDFLLNDDGWKILYNHPIRTPIQDPTYCDWNHNNISLFIIGTDNYINLDRKHIYDNSLWYFKSPDKYNTDISLAYQGWLDFSLIFLSGDFSLLNNLESIPIIKISCNNLLDTIGYFSKNIFNTTNSDCEWDSIHFHIHLDESLWNTPYKNEQKISKKAFTQCLSDVNSFEILGDWTTGIETVGLDSVRIYKPA